MQEKFYNEYLNNCDLNNIDIWELQKSLQDKDLIELDFKDDTIIMIAKNEIYVKSYSPESMPTYCFKLWDVNMYDNYDNIDYIQLKNDNYDDTYFIKIIKDLLEKCNYNLRDDIKKEDILKKIEQYCD